MERGVGRHSIFITGGTGYLGRHLLPILLGRGHEVRLLVRPGSQGKLPKGCQGVLGNALDASSFADAVPPADTLVQLVGIPKPSPAKARQFREVDLVAGLAGLEAAEKAQVRHLVYVSVAHPAPVMNAYITVREQIERAIHQSSVPATILRPWYILGPGHRWPYALIPLYALLERLPSTRNSAQRLGLVTLSQMLTALVEAVENPGVRTVEVPEIRGARMVEVKGSTGSRSRPTDLAA